MTDPVTLDTGVAVSVESVTQDFSLRHEKTLKGMLVNRIKGTQPGTESFRALDDVTIRIPTGHTMGLIGHNGSGKSTLLKVIGGVLTPTSGQVRRRGTLAALLELGAGFHHDLSGRENVQLNAELLGLSKSQIAARFDDIVEFSGVEQFIDTPMKFYSSGMFVRLGFSLAIHTEPDVLLVDEVLAVGDEQFQAKCLGVVRRFQQEGRTIVLVTHNMGDIEAFCDEVVLLHHGVVRSQGPPMTVIGAFRDLIAQDERQRLRSSGDGDARAGARDLGFVRVAKAEASCSSGRIEDFRSGDDIHVRATFLAERPAASWLGRVQLLEGPHVLHGTSTARLGIGPPALSGAYDVEFVLPGVRLAGGRYRIAVEAAPDRDSPAWHTTPAVAEIRLPIDEVRIGPLPIQPRGSGRGSE